MNHPLFNWITETNLSEEEIEEALQSVFERIGIEYQIMGYPLADYGRAEPFEGDSRYFLDAWQPVVPAGFTLAGKYEIANAGPIALFVKPANPYAELLLALGQQFKTNGQPTIGETSSPGREWSPCGRTLCAWMA